MRHANLAGRDSLPMGARAARQALGDGAPPDLIISASGVAHQMLPDNSVFIQEALGYEGIPSQSVLATCLSFPVALATAGSSVEAGAYKCILHDSTCLLLQPIYAVQVTAVHDVPHVCRVLETQQMAIFVSDGRRAAAQEERLRCAFTFS